MTCMFSLRILQRTVHSCKIRPMFNCCFFTRKFKQKFLRYLCMPCVCSAYLLWMLSMVDLPLSSPMRCFFVSLCSERKNLNANATTKLTFIVLKYMFRSICSNKRAKMLQYLRKSKNKSLRKELQVEKWDTHTHKKQIVGTI